MKLNEWVALLFIAIAVSQSLYSNPFNNSNAVFTDKELTLKTNETDMQLLYDSNVNDLYTVFATLKLL